MRVRYLVQLKEPIWLEDHWPIPIMGGDFRVVSKDGKATAFKITFTGQSVNLAPAVQLHEEGPPKYTIIKRDTLLPFVRIQLEKAFIYLQCYFDVDVLIGEIEIEYAGETEEEKKLIEVTGSTRGEKPPLLMPYDILTRAIMAAEIGQAPEFEATFVSAARSAMLQERYIDSFRYSFLLIESLYGNGKYKKIQLKNALRKNADFKTLVTTALNERASSVHHQNSDTEKLLAASPTTEAVIDHLVDKRGLYFHGNVERKDAWRPHEQKIAETLALLSLDIVLLISHAAATPMFDETYSQRHLDNAKIVGAIMTMNVSFKFREPGENFDRNANQIINVPGTKVTPKMAVYAAKSFLESFESSAPVADLKNASCTVKDTGQNVFDIEFHVESDLEIDKDAKS